LRHRAEGVAKWIEFSEGADRESVAGPDHEQRHRRGWNHRGQDGDESFSKIVIAEEPDRGDGDARHRYEDDAGELAIDREAERCAEDQCAFEIGIPEPASEREQRHRQAGHRGAVVRGQRGVAEDDRLHGEEKGGRQGTGVAERVAGGEKESDGGDDEENDAAGAGANEIRPVFAVIVEDAVDLIGEAAARVVAHPAEPRRSG
jgi:hypothetical protein